MSFLSCTNRTNNFMELKYLKFNTDTSLYIAGGKYNSETLESGWSQWPRSLRHVRSSTTRKLGSWVRILLEDFPRFSVLYCPV
jgi:hypothetical protein